VRRSLALFFSFPPVFFCLLSVGCATEYQPRSFFGAGFSQQKLGPDLWYVVFDASGFTPRQRVTDYLMLRCAEITLENGANYFAIVGSTDAARRRSTKPALIDEPPFPLDQPRRTEPLLESRHSARAAIQLYREKPDEVERLYDARKLKQQLEPQVRREKP
jgi:hypothetical protein